MTRFFIEIAYLRLFFTNRRYFRYVRLTRIALIAFKRKDFEKAKQCAKEMLAFAEVFHHDWNHGNAIYFGNEILGLIALRAGDIASAGRHLIDAGNSPGSPQLIIFYPDLRLARELLDHNMTEIVLQFIDLIALFWVTDTTAHPEQSIFRDQVIQSWKKDISDGQIPQDLRWNTKDILFLEYL